MEKGLVSVEWLNQNQNYSNLIILDASPKNTIKGRLSSFSNFSIPNSRFFDLKQNFQNKESHFPNTVPSALQFEKETQSLGINSTSKIIVYDNIGIYTSPRVWWLFKTMGHEDICVLNGGLPEWIDKGYETTKKSDLNNEYALGDFKSNFSNQFVIKYKDIVENIESNKFLIVDARSKGRYNGKEDEPRKYLKSGSIPNSINIPYESLLENGKFKSIKKIKKIFDKRINDQDKLVFSCGSGMTACIVMLASEMAFSKSRYLYDGSWTEYAEINNLRKKEV